MTKQEATKQGRQLLKRMQGSGWKLDVWKNIGWHFCVRNGGMSIYANGGGILDRAWSFSVLLAGNDEDSCGGLAVWALHKSFSDSNLAVLAQLKRAQQYVSGLQGGLDALMQRLKKKTKRELTK
jgi:hypothetical protein